MQPLRPALRGSRSGNRNPLTRTVRWAEPEPSSHSSNDAEHQVSGAEVPTNNSRHDFSHEHDPIRRRSPTQMTADSRTQTNPSFFDGAMTSGDSLCRSSSTSSRPRSSQRQLRPWCGWLSNTNLANHPDARKPIVHSDPNYYGTWLQPSRSRRQPFKNTTNYPISEAHPRRSRRAPSSVDRDEPEATRHSTRRRSVQRNISVPSHHRTRSERNGYSQRHIPLASQFSSDYTRVNQNKSGIVRSQTLIHEFHCSHVPLRSFGKIPKRINGVE